MNFFSALNISTSGLTAERVRMDVIASNIANSEATRTPQGGPYVRKIVTFSENLQRELDKKNNTYEKRIAGVAVNKISNDEFKSEEIIALNDYFFNNEDFLERFTHPDADEDGYVTMPNVNMLNEMIDLITASRAFEANVTAINAEKQMAMKALEIGR